MLEFKFLREQLSLTKKIEIAASREAYEETGIDSFKQVQFIGRQVNRLCGKRLAIIKPASVHERPDSTSEIWTSIRRGLQVCENRYENNYVQVTYQEKDWSLNLVTFELTGWIHTSCISKSIARSYYHFTVGNMGQDHWSQKADGHTFKCFWADIDNLPDIVEPQLKWWLYASETLQYRF